jgi:hypothetical protein
MRVNPAKRHLVLSLDYEIFGNGLGDVRQHVTEPAERMARACERYNVRLTVFVETEELVAFKRYRDALHRELGYSPADLIEEQIASLSSRGHDVQLHLHPEWVGAEYKAGRWLLQPHKGTVDSLYGSAEETGDYIARRKQLLEELSGRDIVAYRAGAFSAQPGAKLLPALAANAVVIDSSVVRGLTRADGHAAFDYRNAPAKSAWRVSQDVAHEDESGSMWEVPIYSVPRRRFQQATWRRLRAKFSRHVPKEKQAEMIKQLGIKGNGAGFLKSLGARVPSKLDFHNVSARTMLRWVKSAAQPSPGLPDVVVAIGHTKEHVDDASFERLLQLVASEPGVEVATFSEVANLLRPEEQARPVAESPRVVWGN